MAIFRHYQDLPEEARGGAVAVGNFDGVHLGHQAVLRRTGAIARELAGPLGVLTFEPHPRSLFQPDAEPFRLTPFRIKARILESLGVEQLCALHFDLEFSHKSAESFVREVLVEGLAVRHAVVGWDFCFGHKRMGDAALLSSMGREFGFGVTVMQPERNGRDAECSGEVYSSSRIREHLREARPEAAAALLGRCFEIEGRVERGSQLGRTLEFPTANLRLGEYLRPAYGIYAVLAGIDEGTETRWRPGVANLGVRPTVAGDDGEELLEVHLFDFMGDLYGRHLRVQLVSFLRAEVRFGDLDAMKAQMLRDAEEARRRLAGRAQTPAFPP